MAEGDDRLCVRSGDLGDHLGAARHLHGRDGLGLRDPRATTRTPSAAVLRRRCRQRAGGDRRRQTAHGPAATTNARSSALRSSSCRSPCRSASSPTPITSTPAPASTGSARSARSSRSPSSSPRPSSPTGDDRNTHPTSDDHHPTRPTAQLAYASTVGGLGDPPRSGWCTSRRIPRSVTPALHLTPTT